MDGVDKTEASRGLVKGLAFERCEVRCRDCNYRQRCPLGVCGRVAREIAARSPAGALPHAGHISAYVPAALYGAYGLLGDRVGRARGRGAAERRRRSQHAGATSAARGELPPPSADRDRSNHVQFARLPAVLSA